MSRKEIKTFANPCALLVRLWEGKRWYATRRAAKGSGAAVEKVERERHGFEQGTGWHSAKRTSRYLTTGHQLYYSNNTMSCTGTSKVEQSCLLLCRAAREGHRKRVTCPFWAGHTRVSYSAENGKEKGTMWRRKRHSGTHSTVSRHEACEGKKLVLGSVPDGAPGRGGALGVRCTWRCTSLRHKNPPAPSLRMRTVAHQWHCDQT
jgi:hypothetical protein